MMPPAYVKPYVKRHRRRGHLRSGHPTNHAVRHDSRPSASNFDTCRAAKRIAQIFT
jgi:hypothetical protein